MKMTVHFARRGFLRRLLSVMSRPASGVLGMALGTAAGILFGAFASTGALAQSDVCRQYRAELSNLERGGGGRNFAAMAEEQRRELNRMVGYYQSLECDRGRLFIFGPPPPAECVSARDRIQAMEANYNQLVRQASRASEERRRALLTAIERNCSQQPRQRGLDGIFGREEPYVDPRTEQERRSERRAGSGRPVCVRLCDGYFFPLANTGGNRDSAQQMCQAQCPAVPTQLFFITGDSELARAVGADGTPYTSLPNAFRYRTTYDETCSCRVEGQSWAEALAQAEQMLGSGRGDIVVNADMARELSLPRDARESPAPRPRVEADATGQGGAGGAERGPVRIVGPDLVPPPNPM
jgi:hypothetical protein